MPSASVNVSGAFRVVGVFGYPVEHSLSPAMHNSAFAALLLPYIYVPFRVSPEGLPGAIAAIRSLGIAGINLTIPHKEAAMQHLDAITPEALEVGAVNTISNRDGLLTGDITDGYGFYAPLAAEGWSAGGRRVVVLGAGGAARSVLFRLAREGALLSVVNRTRERAVRLADSIGRAGYSGVEVVDAADHKAVANAIRECDMLVNTTRIGMYPDVDELPAIPADSLCADTLVYDLVYNPVETRLLRRAKEAGCRTVTGVKMLVHQGAASFHLWTGVWPPVDVMEKSVLQGLA